MSALRIGHPRHRLSHAVPTCVLVALLGAADASAADAVLTRARWLMGTLVTVSAPADSTARTGAALDAALAEIAALERTLSNWDARSELSELNARGASASPSQALAAVVDSALAFARATDGAFDPTVEPLVRAWDLRGKGRVPDAATLAVARARVGHRRVTQSAAGLELGGTQLDLGGIAKGFALDRAAAGLAARGIRDVVLDAGGQLLRTTPGTTWVAHPLDRDRAAVRVRLGAGSLSTSVQRERSLVVRGRRVGHVLDPRTGEPVPGQASVSVAAASGTRADALSTALLVMGRERAQTYAAAHPELGVLWLEPTAHGLAARAWNLAIDSVAAGVHVVTDADADAMSSRLTH